MLNICVQNGLSGSLTQWLQSRYHKELAKHKHGNNIKELALPFVHHVSNTKIQIYENRSTYCMLRADRRNRGLRKRPCTEPSWCHLLFLINFFSTTSTFFHNFNFFSRPQLFFTTLTFFHDLNFFSRLQHSDVTT